MRGRRGASSNDCPARARCASQQGVAHDPVPCWCHRRDDRGGHPVYYRRRPFGRDPAHLRIVEVDVQVLGQVALLRALEGARRGQPPITRPGRDGVPEIPPKAGGLGAILSNAPQLLENLSVLTERLTEVLNPENQRSIQGILANTNRMTGELADAAPRIEAGLSLSNARTGPTV